MQQVEWTLTDELIKSGKLEYDSVHSDRKKQEKSKKHRDF
jgi:hypothetical protein